MTEATAALTAAKAGPGVSGGEPLLAIEGMTKRFGDTTALDAVSLSIAPGEFFTIIGPSGSGKTTLLRIVGGFEVPDSYGAFRLHGLDIARVPPHRRNVATVFQHYALFPHMSVGKNVEYGLKVRGVDGRERRRRALEALELVRMPGTYDREVGTLSGGERQRIALARAFVTEPALLLLDEPLGALDEKLRGEMQLELTQLRAALGVTFVYITHNQDEALTMSDRIAVLRRGRLEQVGTPRQVYECPANTFVAQFMGATNLLEGRLVEVDAAGRARVRVGDAELSGVVTGTGPAPAGAVAWISVRPEHVRAAPVHDSAPRSLVARPLAAAYRGAFVETTFELAGGGRLSVREPAEAARPVHGDVQLVVDPAHAVVLTE